MRRNCTKFVCICSYIIALLAGSSCNDEISVKSPEKPHGIEVGFYASGVQTRTEMLSNGLSTVWSDDDQIALWAVGSDGSYALSRQVFQTYGTDGKRGFFTSTLESPMPEGTYTYYCSYPAPLSVNGTKAVFDVPAVQDGKVTGGADVMVASPVVHGPLTSLPEIEDHLNMRMEMNRMMHQFRFYLPSDNTAAEGAEIEKIVLTFPEPVVGNVQVDLADPSQPAVLASGYRTVTLNLAEPLSNELQNYACVAFVPTAFAEGQTLQVKAYTSDMIAQVDPIDLCARNFQPGHSTPVQLKVNAITDYPYHVTFTVGANNLGENPNSITFTAPQSCVWNESGTNVITYNPGRQIEVGEKITFRFEEEAMFRAFGKQSISVAYDSDNTLTYQTVAMPDMTSGNSASASLTVPYLFYQDFSDIPSFSDGHDDPTVGTSSDTYKGISELSAYSLAGWYGTRIGGQSGTALRICCRYEHVLLAGAYYKGRAYTPFLSNIKDGKDVKISVSFRYGSNRNERKPIFGSRPNKNAIMYFGINTQETVNNPDQSEGDLIDSVTGMVAGSGFSSAAPTSLSPMVISNEKMSTANGSYTSFEGTKNVTVNNVDNGMRLAWIVTTDNTSSNTNGNYWLYIDDIKVQISK